MQKKSNFVKIIIILVKRILALWISEVERLIPHTQELLNIVILSSYVISVSKGSKIAVSCPAFHEKPENFEKQTLDKPTLRDNRVIEFQ